MVGTLGIFYLKMSAKDPDVDPDEVALNKLHHELATITKRQEALVPRGFKGMREYSELGRARISIILEIVRIQNKMAGLGDKTPELPRGKRWPSPMEILS